MRTKKGSMYLEIQTSRKSPVGILRSSFREEGKIKHKQFGRITHCTLEQLKMLQLAFQEKVIPKDAHEAFKIIESKEFGASYAILQFLKNIHLDTTIYSRNEHWVQAVLAMIVGRIIYAGSKLSLCNQFANTSLWELCGCDTKPDVEKQCYLPLDTLLHRQKSIQKKLAKKHFSQSHLVLYDITSSYFEGAYTESDIVSFGYNRDGKKGHEQIVIGLLCTAQGCPIGLEVYPGNTKDETTVIDKVNEIKSQYTLEKIIFVGDRGMITQSNRDALSTVDDLKTITALTHGEIKTLLTRSVIQVDLFDETAIHEVIDPEDTARRYVLCRNPSVAHQEKSVRETLLQLTRDHLGAIANYKKSVRVEQLGARVGKVLSKYKMGKFVKWEVVADTEQPVSRNHRLRWHFDEEKIAYEKRFDGCYIITTDVPQEEMTKQEVVTAYKNLGLVEQAFRNLKTVQLEVRPTFHKKDDRIRAHVFLCMLAYYVQWHMHQKLKPLFEADGKGGDRRWTFKNVVETLSAITRSKVQVNGVTFYQKSEVTDEQKNILDLLGITL